MNQISDTKRTKCIKKASWVAIAGNTVLGISKLIVGLISGSLAVVADAIDTITDILTSFITLITAKEISKPPDHDFPYGYVRAETIATKILAFVIFFAGAQFSFYAFRRIISGEEYALPSMIAIYVTLFSIAGKIFLYSYLCKTGKRINSPMIIANGQNMKNDILISVSVLAGLFFTFILKLPVIDTIIALAVGIWVMRAAVKIFMKTNVELMDGLKDPEIYRKIFKAVDSIEGANNPHRTRVRQIGYKYVIDMDIEVDSEMTVKEAHKISHLIEDKIKEDINDVYDIIIHIEPCGNIDEDEKFGLSKKSIDY